MSRRNGPAARVAIDPAVFVGYIDSLSAYHVGGFPRRRRLCIQGTAVLENDARMIRRWRTGKIEGITVRSAEDLLGRYGLSLADYSTYCYRGNLNPTIRGGLPHG